MFSLTLNHVKGERVLFLAGELQVSVGGLCVCWHSCTHVTGARGVQNDTHFASFAFDGWKTK